MSQYIGNEPEVIDRRSLAVFTPVPWFSILPTVIITIALFFGNIFSFDFGLPSGKNAIGAIFGNLLSAISLIIFELVDYKRRISGLYDDNWGIPKLGAVQLARLVTALGLVLGAIHTFYFITEWSRNW